MAARSIEVDKIKIRALRLSHGYSQADLAEKSGLSRRTIELIEARGRCFNRTLWAIANAFHVEVKELLLDTEKVHRDSEIVLEPPDIFKRKIDKSQTVYQIELTIGMDAISTTTSEMLWSTIRQILSEGSGEVNIRIRDK